jgi:hypothetical protein
MLSALKGIRFDADQTEKTCNRRADAFMKQFRVLEDLLNRSSKRFQNRNRQTGVTAGRINHGVRGITKPLDTSAILSPCR